MAQQMTPPMGQQMNQQMNQQMTPQMTQPMAQQMGQQMGQQIGQQMNQQKPQQEQQPMASMTYRQLEDQINIWLNELSTLESEFHTQAQTINSWDSLLINSAVRITKIDQTVDRLKTENAKLERQLEFIVAQQNELEQMLEPMEKLYSEGLKQANTNSEREDTYKLVETVQNDLQSIGEDLQNFIKKLEDVRTDEDSSNPIHQIEMVLSAQMDTLQWIESQVRQKTKAAVTSI